MMNETYKIVRQYHPSLDRKSRTIKTGLTLAEAQAHCKDPATHKRGEYFDGYSVQKAGGKC